MTAPGGQEGDVRPVSGPLVFDTVPDIYAASKGWFTGSGELVLDLAGVTRVDSAGLALVVEWRRVAQTAGRALRLLNIPAQMRVLARVNGLPGIFPE